MIYPLLIVAYMIFGVYCTWIAIHTESIDGLNKVGKLIYWHGYTFMVALIIIGMLSITRLGLWLIFKLAQDAGTGMY